MLKLVLGSINHCYRKSHSYLGRNLSRKLTQYNDLCFTSLERDLHSYGLIHDEFRDSHSCCPYSLVKIHFYVGNGESRLWQNVGNYQQDCHKTRDWTVGT